MSAIATAPKKQRTASKRTARTYERVTFDAAYPDGLVATEGYLVRHMKQDFVLHEGRKPYSDFDGGKRYRVTHRETGYGIPPVQGNTLAAAEQALRNYLDGKGQEKLDAALAAALAVRPTKRAPTQ